MPRCSWMMVARLVVVMLAGVARADAQAQQPAVRVETDGRVLTVSAPGTYDHVSLRIAAPDGRQFDVEGTGGRVTFTPSAVPGEKLPDGSYTWEVRMMPRGAIDAGLAARARRAPESGREPRPPTAPGPPVPIAVAQVPRTAAAPPDAAPPPAGSEDAHRLALRRAIVLQSGGFQILAGRVVAGQGGERRDPRVQPAREVRRSIAGEVRLASASSAARPRLLDSPLLDQVIADDLIVQGSACVGLDCVNNESFGFDTIRLKENNLRIKFEDTSTAAGFPTNDWQITANDSAQGGLSKFSIDDVTGGKTPFTVRAGASTNALVVDSNGKIGFNTATPVLEMHANTSDTPAMRLEQNNSGGYSAQTWDIGANEANWFVRDVTGGSRLPLRIRPGAPTSSVDINASGNVGIGTASPQSQLHIFGAAAADTFLGIGPNPNGADPNASALNIGHAAGSIGRAAGFFNVRPDSRATPPNPSLRFLTANQERMIVTNVGNVGIGTSNPGFPIELASGAHVTAGGVWTNASSRELKDAIESLTSDEARAAVAALTPVKFVYRIDGSERHVGFIAEEVPALVATPDRRTLSPMDIVAVLTRVVQEQDRRIAELAARVAALEAR